MPGLGKLGNEYAQLLGPLFDNTPKAVLAAVLVSYLARAEGHFSRVQAQLLEEWSVLHQNGIVPQRPPRAK